MENNIRELREKNIIFSKCVDVDLDFQENLMSYNDDMLKIIRCAVNNYIVSTDYKNGNLIVYGKCKIYLTYVSESTSCITTADFEEDFQKSIPISDDVEEICSEIKVINKYSNYRVINQRRIDIHNAFQLCVKVCASKPINMIEYAKDVQIKKEDVSYFSYVGTSLSKADFEEETEIPADSEVIKKIINTFWNCSVDEVKVIKDKMLVKVNLSFSFLYTTDTENEVIKKCEKNFGLSKIIDISGIEEEDIPIVNVNIANLYSKPKVNKNNELRFIELIGEVNINATVYRKIETTITTDSYSIEKEIVNTFDKITINNNCNYTNDVFNDTLLFEFDNIRIIELLDVSLNIIDNKTIELCAVILNENSEVAFISKRKEISVLDYDIISCCVKSFDYVIKSEQAISVRYSIEYSSMNYSEQTYQVLSNIEFTDKVLSESPALVVYFAKDKERIWDIAKKFRSSVDLIKSENELNDDVLDTRRILLIPGM